MIELILNALVILGIVLVLLLNLFKKQKQENFPLIKTVILLLTYFIFFVIFILWLAGFLNYQVFDLIRIYSFVIFFQTLALSNLALELKSRIFIFIFYLSCFLVSFFSELFLPLFIILSFLINLIFSIYSLDTDREKSRTNNIFFFIVYSCYSILVQISLIFNQELFVYLLILSNILFLFFVLTFTTDSSKKEHFSDNTENFIFKFAKSFLFVIILANFTFIGTLSIHELGHFAAAKISPCSGEKIVFDGGFLHTEVVCNGENNLLLLLAGPLIPAILGIFLITLGGRFVKEVSLLMIGFNFLASFKDLLDLGLSETVVISISLFGFIIICFGIFFLAKFRLEDEFIV
jgi:hypothetical protein